MNIAEALMEHMRKIFEQPTAQDTAAVEDARRCVRALLEEFAAPYQTKLDIIAELQKLREWHLEIRWAIKVCLEHRTSNNQQRRDALSSLVELEEASAYEIINCVMRSVD